MHPSHAEGLTRHLSAYARALWNQSPRLARLPTADEPQRLRPALITAPSAGLAPLAEASVQNGRKEATLHLPEHWSRQHLSPALHRAALAHASAHLAYGGPPCARGQLKPIQMALLGVLEDARVEALAIDALPGLRTLWLPWHLADAHSGNSFEALLRRLQRSLLDPHYADPHPWVRKARQAYQAAPPTLAGMRQVASLLGNDIGQMRLPFNARLYVVEPAYRDDNLHLWEPSAEQAKAATQPPDRSPEHGSPAAAPATPAATATYPEWDHLIRRYRPQWCSVHEAPAAAGAPGLAEELQAWLAKQTAVQSRISRLLQRSPSPNWTHTARSADGDRFHLGALVQAAADQRLRHTPDPRVHLHTPQAPARLAVVLLVDASASTGGAAPAGGPGTLLHAICRAALLSAAALEQAGQVCSVLAFASNTRSHVRMQVVKAFDEPATSSATLARLAGLRSEWSTRMGAAVRHACAHLQQLHPRLPAVMRQQVLLITDGEPHDVDVFDRRYLLEDLKQAAGEARRKGVGVSCLDVGTDPAPAVQQALGAQGYRRLNAQQPDLSQLPALLLTCLNQTRR